MKFDKTYNNILFESMGDIKLKDLMVTQNSVKRSEQLPELVEAINNGDYVEPIRISETDYGTFRIEDGTHRAVAYVLSGRESLTYGEYEIVPLNKNRNTIKPLLDFVATIT
jgi:hypothetical protein